MQPAAARRQPPQPAAFVACPQSAQSAASASVWQALSRANVAHASDRDAAAHEQSTWQGARSVGAAQGTRLALLLGHLRLQPLQCRRQPLAARCAARQQRRSGVKRANPTQRRLQRAARGGRRWAAARAAHLSPEMYSRRFVTFARASTKSCRTSTGPTSLNTPASGSKRSSSCARVPRQRALRRAAASADGGGAPRR